MDYQLIICDGTDAQEQMTPTVQLKKDPYTAARPLFKHGREYAEGEQIHLDTYTAARAKAAGDIQ